MNSVNANRLWLVKLDSQTTEVHTSEGSALRSVKYAPGAHISQEYNKGELMMSESNRRWHNYDAIKWVAVE
jgi:hypothetical protein